MGINLLIFRLLLLLLISLFISSILEVFSIRLFFFLALSWIFSFILWLIRVDCLSTTFRQLGYEICTIGVCWGFFFINIEDLLAYWIFARSFGDDSGVSLCLSCSHGVSLFFDVNFLGISCVNFSVEDAEVEVEGGKKTLTFRFFIGAKFFELSIGPWFHFIAIPVSEYRFLVNKFELMYLIMKIFGFDFDGL